MGKPVDPVVTLPRFIAIKGNNSMYLALKPSGILTFDASERTRLASHEVLYNANESTIIIRSANGRFWKRDSSNWIYANLEEPPSRTQSDARFKLVQLDNSDKLALQSAKDNRYLKRFISSKNGYNAVMTRLDVCTEVEVSDASEYAVSLPRYIFLKGNNGKYVHIHYERGHVWLKFHGNEPANLWGTAEVVPLLNGSIALYSPESTNFWRNSTNWIWADAKRDEIATNTRCHFEPIKLSSSMLAIRSIFNGRFCKRLTDWRDSMNAAAMNTNDVDTRFTVSDATSAKSVFDVNYLLNLASTSEQRPLAVAHGSTRNNSSYTMNMAVTAIISQTVSRTRTWSNSFTLRQSVRTSFKAGFPVLAGGKVKVEIGFEQNFSNEWGQTTEQNIGFETQYTVNNVPPGGTASVTVVCCSAKLRIPFTYKSKDTAPDGIDRPTMEYIDGIYEGVDAYNIEAHITGSSPKSYVVPAKLPS